MPCVLTPMQDPPVLPEEAERLAALRRYAILDTPPDERFDRITRLVAGLFSVPISLVSLVDETRQWFKSAVGLEAGGETERRHAFCAHAIAGDELLLVEDALLDERFRNSPLVQGGPKIRFYAGAPLIAPGRHRLGTLCAIDTVPRRLTAAQKQQLHDLAAVITDEMELTAAASALDEHANELARKNELLETLSRSTCHDLAAPLRRVRLLTGFLREDHPDLPNEHVGRIDEAVAYAEHLMGDLRNFLRYEDGWRTSARVSALDELEAARRMLAEPLQDAGARVEADGLTDVLSPAGVLRSVFQNLIGNAIKYRSTAPLRIEIGSRELEDDWEIHVRDNGIGIESQFHERVFQPLKRLHSQSEIPGSGLGLTTCRRLLQRCGGSIRLVSEPGKGTTFLVGVPKALASGTAPALAGADDSATAASPGQA